MNILISFGCIILGFILIYYSKWLVDHTTRIEFFEEHLGGGGTYTFIKLLGLGLIIFGFYILFGNLQF